MTKLQDQFLENHAVADRHECDAQPQPDTLPSWDRFCGEHPVGADIIQRAWVRSPTWAEGMDAIAFAAQSGDRAELVGAAKVLADKRDYYRESAMRRHFGI